MKRSFLFLFFTTLLTGATFNVENNNELKQALGQANTGDMIVLADGDYNRPDGVFENIRTLPNDGQIIIKGNGKATRFLCEPACFIRDMNSVFFDNVTWVGFLNGAIWTNVSFENGFQEDDPATGNQLGILLKCGALPRDESREEKSCVNIVVRNQTVSQFNGAGDMAFDFIASHNVTLEKNTALVLGRGFVQLKGNTTSIRIRGNTLQTGGTINGSRAIQIGGNADAQFWAKEPGVGVYAADDATVENNYIIGGSSCFAIVDSNRVVIKNNTCIGQTSFLFRFLQENQVGDRTGDVLVTKNLFASYTGNEPINHGGTIKWGEIKPSDNLYKSLPVSVWPTGTDVRIVSKTTNTLEIDAFGRVTGPEQFIGYGRLSNDPEVPVNPEIASTLWIVDMAAINGAVYKTESEAVKVISDNIKLTKFQTSPEGVTLERNDVGLVIGVTYKGTSQLQDVFVKVE